MNSDLQDRGEYWQELLGLNDWTIRFEYAPPHELGQAWADNDFDQYHKTALVRILHPNYAALQKWPAPPYSVDTSVVHELVHLLLDPLGANETENELEMTMLEQTINKLTDIFVSLENEQESSE